VKPFLTVHSSGLNYLAGVVSPDQRLNVGPDVLRRQLDGLSTLFGYIVVDLGHQLEPAQIAVVDNASVLLVVTLPEVLAINQTRRTINDLLSATVPGDLIQVLINRQNRTGLPAASVSQGLRYPVVGVIPEDWPSADAALQRSTPMVLTTSSIATPYHDVVRKLAGGVLQKNKGIARQAARPIATDSAPQLAGATTQAKATETRSKIADPLTALKLTVHSDLINETDLKKNLSSTKGDAQKERELRDKTLKVISQLVDRHAAQLSRDDRTKVIKQILDEALGLGALEELLADNSVTEIMVNGSDKIFIEKNGRIQLSPARFTSNLQLRNVIERIVTPLGRRIDEKTPYVDARLQDGSRVNAVIEPIAIDGPSLTIRKFAKDPITPDHYVKWGTCTKSMLDFLRICVEQGLNVVISGGTGSGKTTLLNVLSSYIPANERIVTVEDAAELQLKQEHVVRLETRPSSMEGSGEIAIRDLIRNSLRMRPDRIVVGECRDGAALDMLSAMNTGHDGSMTTVHANSPREAISRLETLCMMAGMEIPARAIREQIAGAVHLIIQISRLSDGSRKVRSITEVAGMQGDQVTLQEIFFYEEQGFDRNRKILGQFRAKGLIPTFLEEFEARGVSIPRNIFTGEAETPAAKAEATGPKLQRPTLSRPTTAPLVPAKKTGSDGGTT
jgi:septum site-determining protein MinD